MEKFVIEGGYPLSGTIAAAGNKNAALPALAACLLTEEDVVLRNVPRIKDVEAMVGLLSGIGVTVEWRDENVVALNAADARPDNVDPELAEQDPRLVPAGGAAAGPLRHRRHAAARRRRDRPPPARPAPRRLHRPRSARSSSTAAPTGCARRAASSPATSSSTSPVVMATENALMAAALTGGSTVIHNAASEPHVQDLARLLMQMGARVEGIGSNVMIVHGSESLGGADYTIGADYIEVASFVALAAVTGGELRVKDVVPVGPAHDLPRVRAAGLPIEFDGNDLVVPADQRLQIRNDEGDATAKIEDGPWPAFPADLTSIALALATQSDGMVLIHEKMFENRLFFVDKLINMGARVILCDPHRAVVAGPRRLHGERMESPDIRAGMAMLIAALCAEGTSEIGNIRQIDRGYERIDERLRALGARIERVATQPVPA